MDPSALSASSEIEGRIYLIRGQRVLLDVDLAKIYGVSTKQLNQQVRRNPERFPEDFMFQLSASEAAALRSQFVTSKKGRGGRRYFPFAFTEHGAVMLASVLKSPLAVQANIIIARAFVKLRRLVSGNREFSRTLLELERRVEGHDADIEHLFKTLRELMDPPEEPPRKIGFQPSEILDE